MKMRSLMNLMKVYLLILVFVTIITDKGIAKTIFVSPTGDNTTGESWQEAFQTINIAYSSSSNGDYIWIESGTYHETLMIRDHSVGLKGGFNGNGNTMEEDLTPIGQKSIMDGSGILANVITTERDLTIEGLVLRNSPGRGLAIVGSKASVSECRIEDNRDGGGVYINSATVDIHHCIIIKNYGGRYSGGIGAYFGSDVLIDSCTIENNEGPYCGGLQFGVTNAVVQNSMIRNNRTTGGGARGGGIQFGLGTWQIINCLMYGNRTNDGPGEQLSVEVGGQCHILNCTICGTSDSIYSYAEEGFPYQIENSILWGSSGILGAGQEVLNSCIQGGYTGLGNISDDPLFRNAVVGDFRLLPESPCIDTAGTSGPSDDLNGNPRPVDIAGIGHEVTDTYDMGAYEFQLNELPTPTPTQTPSQVDPGNTGLYQ